MLQGRRILVVDDEVLIADYVADVLEKAGADVITALKHDQALKLAQKTLDAAVVDHNTGGADLCQMLIEHGVPFVVYSGYAQLAEVCRQGYVLSKPASPDALVHAVKRVLKA